MNDQHDSGPQPELSPEQEATVRRLLSDVRHQDPIPVDVADRLDRVLADLSESSGGSSRSAAVVDLAARRRRRKAGGLLVAAAAVIVGGFAVGQMIDVGGSEGSDSGSDSAVARESPSDASAPGPGAAGAESAAEPLQLTSDNLKQDVESQLAMRSADAAADEAPAQAAPSAAPSDSPSEGQFVCASAPPKAYGAGKFFAAFYDGMPTVLALRPADGDTQEAEVLECGTGTPLQSVTVPAP
jgi:hypothetical protein